MLIGAAALLCLSGCGSYKLQGRAVQGDMSGVWIVDKSDPRLSDPSSHPGLSGVAISVIRDPQSLGGKVVANGSSDGNGVISLTIGEFGAGWMDEQWEIRAARNGYLPAVNLLSLPGKLGDKRILVVLAKGYQPETGQEENLIEQYERFR